MNVGLLNPKFVEESHAQKKFYDLHINNEVRINIVLLQKSENLPQM